MKIEYDFCTNFNAILILPMLTADWGQWYDFEITVGWLFWSVAVGIRK